MADDSFILTTPPTAHSCDLENVASSWACPSLVQRYLLRGVPLNLVAARLLERSGEIQFFGAYPSFQPHSCKHWSPPRPAEPSSYSHNVLYWASVWRYMLCAGDCVRTVLAVPGVSAVHVDVLGLHLALNSRRSWISTAPQCLSPTLAVQSLVFPSCVFPYTLRANPRASCSSPLTLHAVLPSKTSSYTMPYATAADRLPPELIRRIVDFVPSYRDSDRWNYDLEDKRGLAACGQTCRYWASLIRPILFHRLHLRSTSDILQLLQFLESSPAKSKPIPTLRYCIYSIIVALTVEGACVAPWVPLHKLWRLPLPRSPELKLIIRASDQRTLFSGPGPRTLPLSLFIPPNDDFEVEVEGLHLQSPANVLQICRRLLSQYCHTARAHLKLSASHVGSSDNKEYPAWIHFSCKLWPSSGDYRFAFGGPPTFVDVNKLASQFTLGYSLSDLPEVRRHVGGDIITWRTLTQMTSSLLPKGLHMSSCIITGLHRKFVNFSSDNLSEYGDIRASNAPLCPLCDPITDAFHESSRGVHIHKKDSDDGRTYNPRGRKSNL